MRDRQWHCELGFRLEWLCNRGVDHGALQSWDESRKVEVRGAKELNRQTRRRRVALLSEACIASRKKALVR